MAESQKCFLELLSFLQIIGSKGDGMMVALMLNCTEFHFGFIFVPSVEIFCKDVGNKCFFSFW